MGAGLVVVGSHGRGVLSRLFLGSVSQHVLGHAPCSVRIARTRERPTAAPPRLLLAVDGSRDSELAVDEVLRRCWPDGTEVRVLTAIDPQLAMAVAYGSCRPSASRSGSDLVSAAHACAESVARRLSNEGLSAMPCVEEADPKKLLAEMARGWAADCIFLGAKGHRGLERVLLGSVSAAVAAWAPCTVEVVRPPRAEAGR